MHLGLALQPLRAAATAVGAVTAALCVRGEEKEHHRGEAGSGLHAAAGVEGEEHRRGERATAPEWRRGAAAAAASPALGSRCKGKEEPRFGLPATGSGLPARVT
jgi:hypothetical protein